MDNSWMHSSTFFVCVALSPRLLALWTVVLANGMLVTDKTQKLNSWKEHFSGLLNRPPVPPLEDPRHL